MREYSRCAGGRACSNESLSLSRRPRRALSSAGRSDWVCFAPEADAAVGAIVVAVGVDALRHVSARQQLVLAALPMLFGLHQLTEAFVWWGLQGHVAHWLERAAVWAYLLFAFSALPILVPIAVGLIERSSARRRVIGAFGVLAVAVAVALTIAVARSSIAVAIEGRHIAYRLEALDHGGVLTRLYVIATCGAMLASSYRDIAALGVLNVVAVPVLMWLTVSGFVSLWCFWAAIVSILIAFHLRRAPGSALRRRP